MTVRMKAVIRPQNGKINMPASINRSPAKESGLQYRKPIFTPANAVDHKKQARRARKIVEDGSGLFNSCPFVLIPVKTEFSPF